MISSGAFLIRLQLHANQFDRSAAVIQYCRRSPPGTPRDAGERSAALAFAEQAEEPRPPCPERLQDPVQLGRAELFWRAIDRDVAPQILELRNC